MTSVKMDGALLFSPQSVGPDMAAMWSLSQPMFTCQVHCPACPSGAWRGLSGTLSGVGLGQPCLLAQLPFLLQVTLKLPLHTDHPWAWLRSPVDTPVAGGRAAPRHAPGSVGGNLPEA